MKLRRRIALVRRQVRQLAAVAAERRALQAQVARAAPSFRPLSEGEAAAILGPQWLAKLRRSLGESRT